MNTDTLHEVLHSSFARLMWIFNGLCLFVALILFNLELPRPYLFGWFLSAFIVACYVLSAHYIMKERHNKYLFSADRVMANILGGFIVLSPVLIFSLYSRSVLAATLYLFVYAWVVFYTMGATVLAARNEQGRKPRFRLRELKLQ